MFKRFFKFKKSVLFLKRDCLFLKLNYFFGSISNVLEMVTIFIYYGNVWLCSVEVEEMGFRKYCGKLECGDIKDKNNLFGVFK